MSFYRLRQLFNRKKHTLVDFYELPYYGIGDMAEQVGRNECIVMNIGYHLSYIRHCTYGFCYVNNTHLCGTVRNTADDMLLQKLYKAELFDALACRKCLAVKSMLSIHC